jgi:hypothetical protein
MRWDGKQPGLPYLTNDDNALLRRKVMQTCDLPWCQPVFPKMVRTERDYAFLTRSK